MSSFEHNPPELRGTIEKIQATSARYSLAHRLIGSSDEIYRILGQRVRIVQYPFDFSRQIIFRSLLAKQLIVGTYFADLTQDNSDRIFFTVPSSARPLGYEMGTMMQGKFKYDDRRLHSELGGLLAITTKSSGGLVLPQENIGNLISFVDFTHPDEHNLFLVPGAEKLLMRPNLPPLNYYASVLQHSVLSSRFDATAAATFEASFMRVYEQ